MLVVVMLFYTNRRKKQQQLPQKKIRFQQQASESQQPVISWNIDGDTVSIPLKLKMRAPPKRMSKNHLQVPGQRKDTFESSMNSYDESKQIELASSSASIMSSPSMEPEVHNTSQMRSEYDRLTAMVNADQEQVLFGGYNKTRKYTTEGTETDNVTEYTEESESTFDGRGHTTMMKEDNGKKGKKGLPELKLLESMGFEKDVAFAALMQSNYHVPKAISYLILSEQGKTTNGKGKRVTKK